MTLKILQLNIWAGRLFPNLKTFLQNNYFDILNFQEIVTLNPKVNNTDRVTDCIKALQDVLGNDYKGSNSDHTTFTPDSLLASQGNAIFYRNDFKLLKEKTVWLYQRNAPFPGNATSFEDMGRNVLHVTLEVNQKPLDVLSAHLAWARTPLEQPHQRIQNLKLIEYVKNLQNPFILTGDFNIQPDQQSVVDLEKYGKDLTKESRTTNTLNERMHKAWDVIKPGFPVDYIFVSPQIKVKNFQVLSDLDLSDHYGLTAEIEI